MLICRSPYRISLFGGSSDYPIYYREHGGCVINTSIDKHCYLSVRYLPPFFDFKNRIVYSRIEDTQSIDEIQHPSVRECLKFIGINKGIEINHAGDLPARSGIGSSSAFTVGLLNALHVLTNHPIEKRQLALEAIFVEQEMIKENTGSQDQIASAWGGLHYIEFGNHEPKLYDIKCNKEWLESCLLLVFTGFQRNSNEIIKTYEFNESVLSEMKDITKQARYAIEHDNMTAVGQLLEQSWLLKKRLSNQITKPYIDYVYDTAKKAGAIGGKICGSGGGGFMLLFAEPDAHKGITEALKDMLFVPFKFEDEGSKIIVNNGEVG
jgi:D-glycero-alpha-D-manno-heptose-7-phosphate kinase